MEGEKDLGGERRREDEREFKREVGKGGINVQDGLSLRAGCSIQRKRASEKNVFEDLVTARWVFLEVNLVRFITF